MGYGSWDCSFRFTKMQILPVLNEFVWPTDIKSRNIHIKKNFLATWDLSSPVRVTHLCPTLRSHGLYSPWNSPGQDTGVGSLSLLQGIFPTQGRTQVSCIAGGFLTGWATKEALKLWRKWSSLHPVPQTKIKPAPPVLEGRVLITGLPGNSPHFLIS